LKKNKKVYSTAAFQTRTTATVNKKAMKIQTTKGEGEECATTSTTTTNENFQVVSISHLQSLGEG